jgi:hypothetical protein
MTHNCAAIGCHTQVAASMLMCRRHWYMVPKPLRDLVWAAYRNYDRARTPALQSEMLDKLRTAQDAAVSAVARAEKAAAESQSGGVHAG